MDRSVGQWPNPGKRCARPREEYGVSLQGKGQIYEKRYRIAKSGMSRAEKRKEPERQRAYPLSREIGSLGLQTVALVVATRLMLPLISIVASLLGWWRLVSFWLVDRTARQTLRKDAGYTFMRWLNSLRMKRWTFSVTSKGGGINKDIRALGASVAKIRHYCKWLAPFLID